jgi:NAD-dependent DNA ligase
VIVGEEAGSMLDMAREQGVAVVDKVGLRALLARSDGAQQFGAPG